MSPRTDFGLPTRVFLYTFDQLALMLGYEEKILKHTLIFYDARSVGVPPKDQMLARNIAPLATAPEWRVSETELIRWLRYKRYRVYDKTVVGR